MPSARPANVTDFPAGLCVRENTTGNPSCGQKNSDHVSLHRHLDPRHIHSALSLPSEFRSDLLKNTALREAGKTPTKLVTYASIAILLQTSLLTDWQSSSSSPGRGVCMTWILLPILINRDFSRVAKELAIVHPATLCTLYPSSANLCALMHPLHGHVIASGSVGCRSTTNPVVDAAPIRALKSKT